MTRYFGHDLIVKPPALRDVTVLSTVLAAGAFVFAVSALTLLAMPGLFAEWLGLDPTPSTQWTLRMVGAVLIALAGQMWLVRRGSDTTIRQAALVMVVGGGAMTAVTFVIPGEWTAIRFAYLFFGLAFCVIYSVVLLSGWLTRRTFRTPS
jgi:peptidoglycan/LPS O-acetylase OafA/YrhL